MYTRKQNFENGEATFNDLLIFPFLKAAADATEYDGEFKVGEAPLIAMKKQIKDDDEANLYKADGIIKSYDLKELEILLLETSSHFKSKDRSKASFDHHKGLFGALSMLKTIADEFYLGTSDAFSKLKVYFVHATDSSILIWSVRYVPEGPAYELWLEASLLLDTDFKKMSEQLPKALNFYWTMKSLLKQSVEAICDLEKEHEDMLKRYRFAPYPTSNLSSIVNPSIMKLTEAEDKVGMGEIGPFYF